HDVARRHERLETGPTSLGGTRKLTSIEIDGGVGVRRSQVQMMKFRGRKHGGASLQRICATMRRIGWNSTRQGRRMSAGQAISAAMLALAMVAAGAHAQQNSASAVEIDDDDIGGVVTSRFGPEAGVWVIAQTTELGTRFAKIAVTDERGR